MRWSGAGIDYVFLGGELGGRPADRSCYDEDGRVSYPRLAETDLFDDGIGRVVRAADERRVAVMCSEKDPQDCHRALLIARALGERGVAVEHILADGGVEKHEETLDRLLDRFKLPRDGDMFRSRDEVVTEALARQAERVAFVDDRLTAAGGGAGALRVYTIGFTKKPASVFFELLRESGAKRLVDVRLNNVSQLAGFAKRGDLEYLLQKICKMKYVHMPELAPTPEILDAYRKGRMDWTTYERQFLALMDERRVDKMAIKRTIANSCLLCSEDTAERCHRRLVAEYLDRHWGNVEVVHLG